MVWKQLCRDGRGFYMTLDANSFELVHQKTSLRNDDFLQSSEKNHRCLLKCVIAIREEPNLHIV